MNWSPRNQVVVIIQTTDLPEANKNGNLRFKRGKIKETRRWNRKAGWSEKDRNERNNCKTELRRKKERWLWLGVKRGLARGAHALVPYPKEKKSWEQIAIQCWRSNILIESRVRAVISSIYVWFFKCILAHLMLLTRVYRWLNFCRGRLKKMCV